MLRNLVLLTFLLSGLLTAVSATAEEKKVWACAADGTNDEDLYLVEWGAHSYVKLYDVRIWGNFEDNGEERRWDFGEGPNRVAKYSVILKSDGALDYYDFTGIELGQAVEPAYKYHCRLAQS